MAQRPTPLGIAVCALVALNADPSSLLNKVKHKDLSQARLVSFLQAVILNPLRDENLSSFCLQLQNAVATTTVNVLVACLKQLTESIDALIDFFSALDSAVQDGTIDGTSAQGVFVRSVCLGFEQLFFPGIARLWESLKHQVQEMTAAPSLIEEEKQHNENDDTTQTAVNNELWPLSPLQLDAMLRKQCAELQQSNHSFEETEKEICKIMASDPELPAAHFLRFLNYCRHGERVGALHAMHQYFDYAMIQARKDATAPEAIVSKVQDVAQYAAILLAALHHAFGDNVLSSMATEEAVRVSQESRDASSVAYALGWLYCNEMGVDAQDLLKRCSSRASQGHLRGLVAGAHFLLGRHLLGTDTASAAPCWQSLLDATTDPPPSSSTMSLDRPTHTTDVASNDEAMELLSRQVLVGAGIWQAFGLNALSGLSSLVTMQSYGEHLSPYETASVVCNLARVSLYGKCAETFGLDQQNERELKSVLSSSPLQSNTTSCRYATALRMLMRLQETEPQADTAYSVALVLHEWAVRRGNIEHAEYLADVLHSYLHPRMPNYKAAYVETMLQHVLLLSRQGNWEKAKKLAKKLCDNCQSHGRGLRVQHATLLIQLAIIQLESCPNNFIGALPPLLECLNMCESCAMDSLHATALVILAQVFLRMRSTKQAIALLKAALPSLSQHAHIWFVGEAYLTLGKCLLQQAKQEQSSKGAAKLTRTLHSAVDSLEKSVESFRQCQDAARLREAYYLLARTYNSLPDKIKERNEASKRFANVSRHLNKARHSWERGSLSDITHLELLASRPPVDE